MKHVKKINRKNKWKEREWDEYLKKVSSEYTCSESGREKRNVSLEKMEREIDDVVLRMGLVYDLGIGCPMYKADFLLCFNLGVGDCWFSVSVIN